MKKTVSGNEAIAYGALRAGVKVVSGYPGTPSTEVISSLLKMDLPGTYVEWSTNEKTAFEVAAGAALAGSRALCTMKMSGLNVCYDSLIGIAYSGCKGGLVVYVADDPGVTAGMCEQVCPYVGYAHAGTVLCGRDLRADQVCVRAFRADRRAGVCEAGDEQLPVSRLHRD